MLCFILHKLLQLLVLHRIFLLFLKREGGKALAMGAWTL